MKRTRKRIICILAAAAVSVCSLPQSTPMLLRPAITANAAETSGNCGENLTWTLDSDGTLTISGTGDMQDYYHDDMPWTRMRDDIKAAVIEEGVTNIGKSAFYQCKALTSVSIPEGVTSIGEDAFNYCKALTSVTIPEGVTSIGEEAFYLCESLVSVTIPDSVTNIEREAFRASAWLKNEQAKNPFVIVGKMLVNGQACKGAVTIPDGVKYIANNAFEPSSSYDGCNDLTSVTMPDSVTEIGREAFKKCEKLTEVKLSNGLTAVPPAAFEYCKKLDHLVIPDSVTAISNYAFSGCIALSSVAIPESVTEFGQCVFQSSPWLADRQAENPVVTVNGIVIDGKTCKGEVTVPDGVKGIAYGSFLNCEDITSVTLPDGMTAISDMAFGWCSGLNSITIPQSVESIGESAFYNCKDLTIKGYTGSAAETFAEEQGFVFESVGSAEQSKTSGTCGENLTWTLDSEGTLTISGEGEMTNYEYPENPPWYESRKEILNIVIEDGVTTVGKCAFESCENADSVALPDGLTSIGESAFFWCYALKDVRIPEGVTAIGSCAFEGCKSLTEIIVPDSVLADGFGTSVFSGCSALTSAKLPDHLYSVPSFCFQSCPLTEFTIPSEAQWIGERAFFDGKLTSISIPEKVTSIGVMAFYGCPLKKVTVPVYVEKIRNEAFRSSTMTDITIMNPACEIFDDSGVFDIHTVIHGYAGSTAEEYANKYGRRFEEIDPQAPIASDWAEKSVISKDSKEAELVVRVGDIDACNDENAVADHGYDPFTAKSQYAHGYPWLKDETDPAGTDRIFVGSKWSGESADGYASNYAEYKNGNDEENAFGEGALSFTLEYDASEIDIENVILQLCIDDFQALSWDSVFTVSLNGKDAPFIAELLNHTDQTGPTAYIVSAVIPSGFFEDIASGKLTVVIDETTGVGDGYAIDFARLLINYDEQIFTGTFSGKTEPGATVRLLGTSTTVTAASDGSFTFNAIPGINAVRASKTGFVEKYDSGIVLSAGTEWKPALSLEEGKGSPDIDFSKFAETGKLLEGDYNGDKEITVADAVLLARFVSEDTTLTEEEIYKILIAEPDYDDDGLVTILDVTALLKTLGEA